VINQGQKKHIDRTMKIQPFYSIPESEVVRLWRQQAGYQTALEDTNGEFLSIVYPGRLNDSRGGDFRDAVIAFPEGLQRGCIEIHTLTSGWQSHKHHLDPHYNQVVLQVAWKADRGIPARTQNGRAIPTVLLEKLTQVGAGEPAPSAALACRDYAAKRGAGQLEEILDQAGEQRFALKSRAFQAELLTTPSEQVLYSGLAQALGYSHNQHAFKDFAQRAPLSAGYDLCGPEAVPDLNRIQSFLLGSAGMLPSQRGIKLVSEGYIENLEGIWSENRWQALAPLPGWEWYKVRPGNYPVRRLIVLSQWLWQARITEWQANFLYPVIWNAPAQARIKLIHNLRVDSHPYWSYHFDFGRPLTPSGSALLGGDRIGDMIINIILPFLLAWAGSHSQPELAERSLIMYRQHPALEVNSIQRHMSAQLAIPSKSLNSACRQQGLLHIYKTFCTQGRCVECPLSV
jgi:hypothetical protein